MKHLLRNLVLTFALIQASFALAQPTPPFTVVLTGVVNDCAPQSVVSLQTIQGTQPAVNMVLPVNAADCSFSVTLEMESFTGWFQLSSFCFGNWQNEVVAYTVNAFFPDTTFVTIAIECGSGMLDCLGVPGGNAMPGTPCDDGDPMTISDTWSLGCTCSGISPDTCHTWAQFGQTIIDGDPVPYQVDVVATTQGVEPITYSWSFGWPFVLEGTSTDPNWTHTYQGLEALGVLVEAVDANGCYSSWSNVEGAMGCDGIIGHVPGVSCTIPGTLQVGVWSQNCTCVADPTQVDCMGVIGGNALPGTPCNTPAGNMGMYDAQCNCVETSTAVEACISMSQIAPFTAVFSSCTTGGTPAYDNLWDFSDGGAVTGDNISHTYAGPGTYTVCLNVTDQDGYFDATCEQVYVDANGGISFDPPAGCEACFNVIPVMNGNNPVPFQANFINCSTGAPTLSYIWTLPNGLNSSQPNQQNFTFNGAGIYGLCLQITDGMGCTSELCDTIVVDPNGGINTIQAWYDCMGVLWGNSTVGTPCNHPVTGPGTWSADCDCVPDNPASCEACFTFNSPAPFVVDLSNNCSTFPSGENDVLWVLPDGSTIQPPPPSHLFSPSYTFDSAGVYVFCFTILDYGPLLGCTFCDTLYVDEQGNVTSTPPSAPDCLGVVNGPNLPGTPCQQAGFIGTWDADCNCVPNSPGDCEASFWVLQAYENGNTPGTGTPIPNTLWVWNLTNGGTGFYQFVWDFGDGSTSTEAFPTHIYADSGPYELCLTITDSDGCTDTYCDSVSVDEDGIYSGLIGDTGNRTALTLNVVNPLTTGIDEEEMLATISLWPNPARELLNIALDSRTAGSVRLEVVDLNGRILMERQELLNLGGNRLQLGTEDLPAGLYALRISQGTNVITQRFVRD